MWQLFIVRKSLNEICPVTEERRFFVIDITKMKIIMENKGKFYLTTAIAYASRKPHIGNTYEIIFADTIARYKRLCGYDVFLLTGTDEHGQKIENLARESGISPKEYVDGIAGEIQSIWAAVNSSHDKFIRTTDDYHKKAVQHIFKKLYDSGDIYKSEYEGWYCVPCEAFFTDTQAQDGKCPDCGRPLKRTKEEAYFFRMSQYQDRLMKYIEENPDFIVPESRKKEMINNFLKPGLQDLCVSRSSFRWGIPVPFDDKHVIYVWIDALSNYITALGYDVDEKGTLYQKNWPCDLHIIGKDILRFHTIYWPIILMALGEPLPKQIFGHPWLNFGNDKMSKSKGNVIYADDLIRHFGVDGVRYYALAEMPYANDGSITYENIILRYNMDLANNLGNLVSRTVAMTNKYFDGSIRKDGAAAAPDEELIQAVLSAKEQYMALMDSLHVAEAASAVFSMLRLANKYIDETTPWTLAKDEACKDRLQRVLYNLLETIRFAAVMLQPFMPETCEKIFNALGTDQKSFDTLQLFGGLKDGKTGESVVLFARIDEEKMLQTLAAENSAETGAAEQQEEALPEVAEEITIDTFAKADIRAAKILACEPVKKSEKLLKLQLDLGFETRQVVSGIAKYYQPDELIGKTVAMVANLKPVKLCGVESRGMILASGEKDVHVVFLDSHVRPGEKIH